MASSQQINNKPSNWNNDTRTDDGGGYARESRC